ncbi:hypothetical protein MPER_00032 [Moniliophthora perniciosa FA553]|nr:hypothetical protein MPER_00032 [Moniliophthora perniciosa FA553]
MEFSGMKVLALYGRSVRHANTSRLGTESAGASITPHLAAVAAACPDQVKTSTAKMQRCSFSTLSVRKEEWLYVIPCGPNSEHAAPLMCAGAATLIDYVKPINRIGIGCRYIGRNWRSRPLAIQFAAKMGCDIVVFSSSESKREVA